MAQKKPANLLQDTLKTARSVFWYVGAFSCVINVLMLMVPMYSMQVLDRVLSTGSLDTLFWLSVIMVAIFLVAAFLQTIRAFALMRTGEWIDQRLGQPLLLNTLAGAALAPSTRGTQALRDLTTVKNFLTGSGLVTLFDAPWSLIYIGVIFLIHPTLGWLATAGCALLFGLAWLNQLAMRSPMEEANEEYLKTMHHVDIAVRNAEAIEAMGMMHTVAQRWGAEYRRVTNLQTQANQRSAVLQSFSKFIRLCLQIGVTGTGAYLALQHQMTAGSIIAVSILSGRALAPFEAAIATWRAVMDARSAYARLHQSWESKTAARGETSLPAPRGRISVDNVIFAPPNVKKPVLKGVSFDLEAGEALGVIGPSAAGKSTLARLLIGTHKPINGAVRLDGADVYQWRRDEFGLHVGYLPQDVELFSGTVKDNIARLRRDASDMEVIQAAQVAGAHEMILSLPHGYETDIGPGGASLSAGQRQRIGLARALFGNPRLLVLDEPDANLDGQGERALALALRQAKLAGTTCIIISHRKAILKQVDKILVLQGGLLKMFGPADEVFAAMSGQGIKESVREEQIAAPRPEIGPIRVIPGAA